MTEDIKRELFNMYDELQTHKLEVILIPASESMHSGHKIRVAANHNPEWYRDLCEKYQSNCPSHKNRSKSDTKIKRQAILNFLSNPDKHQNFKYKDDLLEIAEQRIENYYSECLSHFKS